MAVKARNRKRLERERTTKEAVRIKCCYCDIRDVCIRRSGKEKDERLGRMTSCLITPNSPKSSKKSKAKKC